MHFLERLRAKLRKNGARNDAAARAAADSRGRDASQVLPTAVVHRILSFVCPHALDSSYESLGHSAPGDLCPLCAARDLAHVALTCQAWNTIATRLLYVKEGLAGSRLTVKVPEYSH
jgi:hypothetical protein